MCVLLICLVCLRSGRRVLELGVWVLFLRGVGLRRGGRRWRVCGRRERLVVRMGLGLGCVVCLGVYRWVCLREVCLCLWGRGVLAMGPVWGPWGLGMPSGQLRVRL